MLAPLSSGTNPGFEARSGRKTAKQVPLRPDRVLLRTWIKPSCFFTIPLLTQRPSPVPSHYLLGEALRLGGSAAEAPHHYAEARRILDGVAKESHSDTLLKRSDLANLYQESAQHQCPTS